MVNHTLLCGSLSNCIKQLTCVALMLRTVANTLAQASLYTYIIILSTHLPPHVHLTLHEVYRQTWITCARGEHVTKCQRILGFDKYIRYTFFDWGCSCTVSWGSTQSDKVFWRSEGGHRPHAPVLGHGPNPSSKRPEHVTIGRAMPLPLSWQVL